MKKIELLQSVALFWDLSEEELGYISEKMIARHYKSGNYIFLEDSEGEQCFFVVQGSVDLAIEVGTFKVLTTGYFNYNLIKVQDDGSSDDGSVYFGEQSTSAYPSTVSSSKYVKQ